VAKIGVLTTAWSYVVLKPSHQFHEFLVAPVPSFLGIADVQFGESSVSGKTHFVSSNNRIEIRATIGAVGGGKPKRLGWETTVNVSTPNGSRIAAKFHVYSNRDALALVYPLSNGSRVAYTHKEGGMLATGSVSLGNLTFQFDGLQQPQGLASMDWTRSLADRMTVWNWACLSSRAKNGKRIGINLSKGVYDHQENAVWVDGQIHTVGPVKFTVPSNPSKDVWYISSTPQSTIRLELEFYPRALREEHIHAVIVESDFFQPLGTFRGVIQIGDEQLEIEDGFGVVEDHYALW